VADGPRREPGFDEESEAYGLFVQGMTFLHGRRPAQAAMLLARALRLEPGKNSIREGLARALYALGRHEQAAEQFAAIVAGTPDNDYAQYCLGRCLLALRRAGEARAHLRLARALKPESALYREALQALDEAR
jgi:Flp pilus assembly protein TadD